MRSDKPDARNFTAEQNARDPLPSSGSSSCAWTAWWS
jgi:hypothetical protein